jgi:hypothetical protein
MADGEHRSARSGLSGEVVPESEVQEVTVSLADGQIRRIQITADEASRILRYGRNLSPWWRRLAFGMRAPSAVLVAAIIAGLVLPALTRQWSDRQREFDVKEALIQKINSTIDSSVWLSRSIARGGLPVVARRNYACSPPRGARDSKSCLAAREDTAITQSTRLAQSEDQLRRAATSIAADIRLYFPSARQSGKDLPALWSQYVGAILAYQELAGNICNEGRKRPRADKFEILERWFSSSPLAGNQEGKPTVSAHPLANYGVLGSQPGCHFRDLSQLDKSGTFVKAYGEVGDRILLAGTLMASPLVDSSGRGFSDTRSDFAHDVGRPTIAFLALALLWTLLLYGFRALTYWPPTYDDDSDGSAGRTKSGEPE